MAESYEERALRLLKAPAEFGSVEEWIDALIAEEDARLEAEKERRLAAARTPLERLLIEHGISQTWLAAQIGVTQPAVNRWAKGAAPLPPERVEQIEELLGCGDELAAMRPMRDIALEGNPLDNYFGYCVFWARVGAHLRYDTDAQLVKEAAEVMDLPLRTVQEWQYGLAYPTEEQAEVWLRRYLPGVMDRWGLA